jgi:hypothetical protein
MLLLMENQEIFLSALLIIVFLLIPYMNNNLLSFLDNPFVRVIMLLVPFALMNISHRLGLIGLVVVCTMFLERNHGKITASSAWWRAADGTSVPRPLPGDIPEYSMSGNKTYHDSPFLPENEACDIESPIIDSDLQPRPILDTLIGDSSMHGAINSINSRLPGPNMGHLMNGTDPSDMQESRDF